MSEEELDELMEYNLEYLEARNSEDIFGGDYTTAVDLKYANKEIEQLQQENKELKENSTWWSNRFNAVERDKRELKERINKAINELDKLNIKLKEILSIGIDIREISYIEKILKGDSNV